MTRPRGRPRLSRSIFSYEGATLVVPPEVVLDTSFVVEAVSPRQPGHAGAQEYLSRLLENETTLFFNRLLEVELLEAGFKLALKERFGRDWWRRRADGRARHRAGRLMEEALGSWRETLAYFDYLCVELEEVVPDVSDLMRRFGLNSNDAVHVATAFYIGVPNIVTRDVDFARVPHGMLTIYTDATRVASCRAVRRR